MNYAAEITYLISVSFWVVSIVPYAWLVTKLLPEPLPALLYLLLATIAETCPLFYNLSWISQIRASAAIAIIVALGRRELGVDKVLTFLRGNW